MTEQQPQPIRRMAKGTDPIAGGRVLTRYVAATVNYVLSQGASMDTVTKQTGIKRIELLDPETRLRDSVIPKLWALVVPRDGDLSPGLNMAGATSPSEIGAGAHLIRYATDLSAGLAAFIRFRAAWADDLKISLLDSMSPWSLQIGHPLDEFDNGNAAEARLGLVFRLIVEGLGGNPIVGVDLAHAPLSAAAGYERFFDAPVRFRQRQNALFLDRNVLTRSMPHADSQLFDYAAAKLELMEERWRLPGERSLLSRIYDAVQLNADAGKFSTEELAAALEMNPRKIQREVKKFNLTVSKILEGAREVAARRLLSNHDTAIDEVASQLGYADARGFRRAFLRWTNETPAAYRKRTNK